MTIRVKCFSLNPLRTESIKSTTLIEKSYGVIGLNTYSNSNGLNVGPNKSKLINPIIGFSKP